MAEPAARKHLTPQEYLAFERTSEERHEYLDGQVVAMTGGSVQHSLICSNIAGELRQALRGRPCFVFPSDMRVKIAASGRYTYQDVSAVCGELEVEDEERDTLLNPQVIFEVLSPSTESYDRGEKFAHYRTLTSLTDYVLVSQKQVQVEHFHRRDDGTWLLRALGPGESLQLETLSCELAVDELYLQVPPEGRRSQPRKNANS